MTSRAKRRAAFALLLPLLSACGCIELAGRSRPRWSPGWSSVKASPASADAATPNVQVVVAVSNARLSDVVVLATPLAANGALDSRSVMKITGADGRADLSLSPGRWEIETELYRYPSVKRRLTVKPNTAYVIEMYTLPPVGPSEIVY